MAAWKYPNNSSGWGINCTDSDNDGVQDRAFSNQRQWCHQGPVASSLDHLRSFQYGVQRTELYPTESHGMKRHRTQTQSYQACFTWWGDAVTPLPTTESNCKREQLTTRDCSLKIKNTNTRSLSYTKQGYELHSSTEQHWHNRRIPSENPFCAWLREL